jgi:hypothetical protein
MARQITCLLAKQLLEEKWNYCFLFDIALILDGKWNEANNLNEKL